MKPTIAGHEAVDHKERARAADRPLMSVPANWRDDAACIYADPDLFFPVSATGPALRQIDEAKRACLGCPARTPCLAWAVEHGVAAGIWGGATEDERRAMRKASVRNGSRV